MTASQSDGFSPCGISLQGIIKWRADYSVIGKRAADAVTRQDNMELARVADINVHWRPLMAMRKGVRLFATNEGPSEAMWSASLNVAGSLDDLLEASGVEATMIVRVFDAHLGTETRPNGAQQRHCGR